MWSSPASAGISEPEATASDIASRRFAAATPS